MCYTHTIQCDIGTGSLVAGFASGKCCNLVHPMITFCNPKDQGGNHQISENQGPQENAIGNELTDTIIPDRPISRSLRRISTCPVQAGISWDQWRIRPGCTTLCPELDHVPPMPQKSWYLPHKNTVLKYVCTCYLYTVVSKKALQLEGAVFGS